MRNCPRGTITRTYVEPFLPFVSLRNFPKVGISSKYLRSKPFVVPTENHGDFGKRGKRDGLAVVARNLSGPADWGFGCFLVLFIN